MVTGELGEKTVRVGGRLGWRGGGCWKAGVGGKCSQVQSSFLFSLRGHQDSIWYCCLRLSPFSSLKPLLLPRYPHIRILV